MNDVEAVSGRRVLVTGGAGFIGSHLVDRLVQENEVVVLDNLSRESDYQFPDVVEFVSADVRDEDVLASHMREIDIVFHEAAVVSVVESVNDPVESHDVNVNGTLSVLEAARRNDARVVFASSTAIFGEPDELPIAESHRKEPTSPYGAQKLSADIYVRQYAELYALETVGLRYFNVYGPRQRSGPYGGVISVFIDQALEGDPITVHGDGTQTRDFVHVSDIVEANMLAATTDATGGCYNVGTGREISIRELAELVRDLAGTESRIVHEDPRPGDIEQSRAEIRRSRNALGFTPQASLEEGLADLIDRRS